MQVVGEHAEEELAIVVVDEAVVEDARRLMRVQQRAVVRVVDHCLVGLHQAVNHLRQPQACMEQSWDSNLTQKFLREWIPARALCS